MKNKTVKFSKEYNLKLNVSDIVNSSTRKFRFKKIKDAYTELASIVGFNKSFKQNSNIKIFILNESQFVIDTTIRSEIYYSNFEFKLYINKDKILINKNNKEISMEEFKKQYYMWEYKMLEYNIKTIAVDFCTTDEYINNSRDDYITLIESYMT